MTASLDITNSAEVPGVTFAAHRLDEVVVDADVGQRAGQRAGRGADRHAEQRDEEQQPEQQAPERAAERARAREVVQLAGLRLLRPFGATHRRRVVRP